MSGDWKIQIASAVSSGDRELLLDFARRSLTRVMRYLTSRLYSAEEAERELAVRALGVVAAEAGVLEPRRAVDLLRRFVWALNDESGAVPYGIPEAIGEMLAVRPEFQAAFLPILCSLLTEEEMSQTGPVERGALWAVGRVGKPVAVYSPKAVEAVRRAAASHPEAAARRVAAWALGEITGEIGGGADGHAEER